MRKPIIGTIQLLLMCFAIILVLTVFLTSFGIAIWFIDLMWALAVGILWYKERAIIPQIICNLILPGFGTLYMGKPITGIIQLLLMGVSIIMVLNLSLNIFSITIWVIDLVWALIIGISQYRRNNLGDG
ncbi:hypothetical protein [Lentilitoribacter sp. EG35]|uniref:hypothetical protein n=1 Tax=Lentilitoribacter sp. EG35 TaxID=3234192 RepID=UPI0034613729